MAEPKLAQVCINVPINPEILNTQYGKNLYNYLVGEGIAELITAYSEEEINPVLEGWLNTANKFGRKKVFKSTDVAECIKIIRDTVLERDTSPEVSPTNIVQLSLEDERAQIFGEGSILELTRTKGFRTQMIQTFLVNESLNTLVSSNEELNESILNYKKQQFSAILECLKLYNFSFRLSRGSAKIRAFQSRGFAAVGELGFQATIKKMQHGALGDNRQHHRPYCEKIAENPAESGNNQVESVIYA